MRLLSALTLLISVSLSSFSFADPVELQWEFEVSSNQFLTRSRLVTYTLNTSSQGGCVVTLELEDADSGVVSHAIFALRADGDLGWKSPVFSERPKVVLYQKDVLVYRFSSQGGHVKYFDVPLSSGNVNETPLRLHISGPLFTGSWPYTSRDSFFFTHTNLGAAGLENGGRVIIQKWAVPEATPTLAPSSFGIDEGNLIISWPTTAVQSYQVQRSTDLQSWENIGVALTGNGTTMSYSQPSNAAKVFLRVVIP